MEFLPELNRDSMEFLPVVNRNSIIQAVTAFAETVINGQSWKVSTGVLALDAVVLRGVWTPRTNANSSKRCLACYVIDL